MKGNMRHYKATMRNGILYAAETVTIGRHGAIQLEKEEKTLFEDTKNQKEE